MSPVSKVGFGEEAIRNLVMPMWLPHTVSAFTGSNAGYIHPTLALRPAVHPREVFVRDGSTDKEQSRF